MRDVTNAGLVVSDRIGRDVASQLDLEEALEASRYASHPYSTHPREWPPLAEVVDHRDLPPVLIERYNAAGGEGTTLCGIFPEIRRAWASIDNSIFLWRFDKWDGQCLEYSGEDQAICAVGLAKSKPGVFVEAIQYLLILATPVQLILVGVCCSGGADGTDPYAEVSLPPLPEYTVPSDGITMTCITCTDKGRIFLAGRDGHIYELHYTTGSGWQTRCRKVCLTAGIGSIISRWVVPNVFKFGAVDPIIEMVYDNERHILYSRTEEMKLQVFILGQNADGPLKKVAEEKNLINLRDAHYGGRQSAGPRAANRMTKSSIVCISPLSTLESKSLHLVAVLSDGRRMYLTTSPSSGNLGGFNTDHHKPSCLKVVTTRPSPPLGLSGGLAFGTMSLAGRPQNDDLALKVEAAHYSAGTLILSDSSPPTMSSLLIVNRDSSTQSAGSSTLGTSSRSSRALRESVSSLPVEGRMLFVADILPPPDIATTVLSLYSAIECGGYEGLEESCDKVSAKLWARGDLSIQHILPRRRVVVFSTMGMMEIVFNRPVDILRRLFESNSPRSILEEFFSRFGAGEAAAMCLMLAARIVHSENLITNVVAQKAAEAFEDPRFVGMPQLEGNSALSNTRTAAGGFSMGQVVQEAEPVFSGAHEGLCLCSSRLLFPLWELPVVIVKGGLGSPGAISENGLVICRLSLEAMQVLENKLRSLEKFLRSRRNQRRGLYGHVAGSGDLTGSILYGTGSELGASDHIVRNLFGAYSRNTESNAGGMSNKRQRLPYSPAELAAMEVRAMECIRQLLLRSSEALFLLQLLSQHHLTRLVESFDANLRQALVQMTFNQLVCSEEGDQLATRLISALMEYYTGPDGRGAVDDISARLREGCPSYYKESDYKFFRAVECLERAAVLPDPVEKENLAREAFNFLSKVPESADLRTVCKRFEDLRFYEAVVRLPLQKAQALDPASDAFNDQIDAADREHAIAQRVQCYEIIISALRSLKGDTSQREFGSPLRPAAAQPVLDKVSRNKYICQIVQLGIQSPDRLFHEYLYRAMIDLGLENELLENGGPDLVPFLQSAAREHTQEVRAISAVTSVASPMGHSGTPMPSKQAKYSDLLARYYILKRQHLLAAHVLLRLAERRSTDSGDVPTLDERCHYLENAIIQAKNASSSDGLVGSTHGAYDNGLLELLEGKLAVLRFQIKIKEELQAVVSRVEDLPGASESGGSDPNSTLTGDSNFVNIARGKAKELSLDLKSITQLYNDYAVPFELWEICLEMLYFASYSGDPDSSMVRETWARLIDQALSRGGVAEACSVLKRFGSHIYLGDGAGLPLDTLCLHLEKAALERQESGVESVGDEDVARALLAACKGATEPVLNTYDQLLTSGAILPSPNLRLRLLRSVLVILREWAMSLFAQRMGTSATGASLILGGTFSGEQRAVINQGVRDKISSAANRYMTEVRRLALPQHYTEPVFQGFRELEESLLNPFSFDRF